MFIKSIIPRDGKIFVTIITLANLWYFFMSCNSYIVTLGRACMRAKFASFIFCFKNFSTMFACFVHANIPEY